MTRAYRTDYTVLEEEVQIHTVLSVSAVIIQRILDIDATWTIRANGRIDVKLDVKKDPEFPELPRFGLRLFLPRDMADITYTMDLALWRVIRINAEPAIMMSSMPP